MLIAHILSPPLLTFDDCEIKTRSTELDIFGSLWDEQFRTERASRSFAIACDKFVLRGLDLKRNLWSSKFIFKRYPLEYYILTNNSKQVSRDSFKVPPKFPFNLQSLPSRSSRDEKFPPIPFRLHPWLYPIITGRPMFSKPKQRDGTI